MNNQISPKYQMSLIKSINENLFTLYRGYADVELYIQKWYECDEYGNWENFNIQKKKSKDGQNVIDAYATLHSMSGELLLKIAIDLGLETPDFIPSIPTFKNELKLSFETAAQTFDKAYCNVEKDPSIAVGLANSALESIIKEILKDNRILIPYNETDTLSTLIKKICRAFHINNDASCPTEIKTIASSLISCSNAVENMRSSKTELHGKTQDDFIITDPLCAYFIVNAVSTVGLFLLNYYKERYPSGINNAPSATDSLPF